MTDPMPAFDRALLHPRYWPTWFGLGVLWLVSLLPLVALQGLGAALGELAFVLHPPRRRVVLTNLRLCFPELGEGVRRRLARRHLRALMYALLTVPVAWWGGARRLKAFIHHRDRHYYEDLLAQGKRVILLAPHFVSLEIAGALLSSERPMVSMYIPPKNPVVAWCMARARARFGLIMLPRIAGLKPLVRHMRDGRPFYYLPDQDLGREGAVFVPFFHEPAATITALSGIARLMHAAVVPVFTRALPWGRGYEFRFGPALDNFPSGDEREDAAYMNRVIEAGIRTMPEQYFWVHKRFKTRPEGAARVY